MYSNRFCLQLSGVKTISEPPNCFRDSMLEIMNLDFVQSHSESRVTSADNSFQSVNPSQVEKENVLYRSDSWRRISLALYCFHSLILERTRYGSLAFAGRVEFTFNDLKSALTLIKVNYLCTVIVLKTT